MVKTTYFEEYEVGASRETLGRTITESDIVTHAGQTGDFFPHHVDAEWSKTNEFGQRIAHGTLILSIGAGMTATEINPVSFSYGYDRVRFIRPVFIGDTIHVRLTVKDKRAYPRRTTHGVLVDLLEVINQDGHVVLACEHLSLVERQTPTERVTHIVQGVSMESIRAVVVDPDTEKRLTIQNVNPPSPLSSEAVIRVKAASLNLGEVRFSMNAEAGWRPGWDLAGVVERAAADGSGPPVGSRVVGFVPSGAWAEQVAVPTHALAIVPDGVSFAQASTLPVAGLTALYSLERNGSLLGQSVLITGASGGVGHLGCTLARHMGAHVVASVRRPERAQHARDAGAHEVVVGEDIAGAAAFGPYHMIVESVGSETLTKALSMLGPDGMCVTCGVSAGAEVTLNARDFFRIGAAKLYGFILFHEVKTYPASAGLSRLAQLVADGILKPQIEVEAPWSTIADVAQRFFNREIAGKAVLLL